MAQSRCSVGLGVRVGVLAVILLLASLAVGCGGPLPPAQGPDQIAYLGSGGSIWLADVESGEAKQLADAQGFTSLDWSPDGRRLLLVAGGSLEQGQGEVYLLEPESRGLTRIGDGYAPIWTSDSEHVLYVSSFTFTEEGREQSLIRYNLQDGSGEALVTKRWISGLWPIGRVAYSADEQLIAVYIAGLEMEGFVVIVDQEGKSVWEVPDMVYSPESFDWSSDSHELVYRDSGEPFMGGEVPSLKIVDVDTRETTQSFQEAGFWPRWSPDGEAVAALVWGEGSAFRVMMLASGEGEPVVLSDEVLGGLWDSGLRWSPDGSLLAFSSTQEGQGQIYVMDRAGTVVTVGEGEDPELSWSPDGERVAVAVGGSGAREVFIVAADGSGQRKVAEGSMPVWRPMAEED